MTISNKTSTITWGVLFVFFCLARHTDVFAQTAAQKTSLPDVVEVESDIDVDQFKPGAKAGIKPRASYTGSDDSKKKASSSAAQGAPVPVAAVDVPGQDDDVEEVESVITGKNVVAVSSNSEFKIKTIENPLTDTQVIEISGSLRGLIEENERLKRELDSLDAQLRTVKGQQRLESTRMNEIAIERDALKQQNQSIIASGYEAEQRRVQIEKELTQKESEYNNQIGLLQTQLSQALQSKSAETAEVSAEESAVIPGVASANPSSRGSKSISVEVASSASEDVKKRGEKVLVALDTVNKERIKLTRDEAKLHYNMGNTYYNQGDYRRALIEYTRAVDLAPDDANAHYNLAFVSGEILNEPLMALQHYKMYLFLNPGAEDAQIVRQKIIEAEITVKADVHFNSPINRELKQKKNEFNDATQF